MATDSVFDFREFIHYNRHMAALSFLMLDLKSVRYYLARNKQIHRTERLLERRHYVN